MNYKILLPIITVLLTGCGGGTCDGHFSSGTNITVKDYSTGDIIDSANVTVYSKGQIYSESWDATYIDGDDGLGNSEDYAYYTLMGINESSFVVSFTVSLDGFDTYDSEEIEFKVNTECEGVNNISRTIYLCPNDLVCESM